MTGRVSFATVAVFGLGAFVAVAVGVTLYVSASSGVRSTQLLIAQQAETLLDTLEYRLRARLAPVAEQADWIARSAAEARIDLAPSAKLDAFMLGALGATPQVLGIAIVDPSGRALRWSREHPAAIREDWSQRAEVLDWVFGGRRRSAPAWGQPLWTPATHVPALLHDMPLRRGGRFLGMLGQAVAIATLSEDLAAFQTEHRVTPFVLYGVDFVLAHPRLAAGQDAPPREDPLPRLAQLGDPVLARLRSPDVDSPLGMRALKRAQARAAEVDGTTFVYITRTMPPFGPQPWTLGVYLDPAQAGLRAEVLRVLQSIAAGLAVLVVAVLAAAFAGRRVGRPIEALARAAHAVREGRLDDVPHLPRSRIAELDDASRSFGEMLEGLRERRLIRDTLGQFVPEEVARKLLSGGGRLEPVEAKATVLVCDIEGFAALTDTLGARRVIEFLNAYFETVVGIVERHGGTITQFQGDAILAVFNVPLADRDHAANALRASLEIVRAADAQAFAGVRTRNRIGLSTGRVVAGAVGSQGRLSYTVHGNAVNLAARLEALNKDYGTRILLSGKTAERCPGFALKKLGDVEVRGYGEPLELYTPAL
jgi:class 3 adenylate cyclase